MGTTSNGPDSNKSNNTEKKQRSWKTRFMDFLVSGGFIFLVVLGVAIAFGINMLIKWLTQP